MALQTFDLEGGKFQSYFDLFPPTSLSRTSIAQMFIDKTGSLWVATGLELKRLNLQSGVFYDIEQNKPFLRDWTVLNNFYEDKNGILWFGTLSRGVLRYAPSANKFRYYPQTFPKGEYLSDNLMRHLYEDSRGHLWSRTPTGTDHYFFDKNDELQKVRHYPFHAVYFLEDSSQRIEKIQFKFRAFYQLP